MSITLDIPNNIHEALHVSPTEAEKRLKLAQDRAAILKNLRGGGRKYLKPGQDPIAELIAEREREG